MINLKIRINVDEQTLTLPVDTQFVPGIPEKDPVVMVTEITEPEELKYLERDEWNIEELNFLAKRMESFDKREQSQFDAAVSIFRPKTVEALINYTYNLPRFTLISDFSTPNAIGVSHILNRKQVMSLDEMASTDFAKIGKELMQSGKGITTPYGDGYRDGYHAAMDETEPPTVVCTDEDDCDDEDSPCYDCPYYCPECGSCTRTEDDCDE